MGQRPANLPKDDRLDLASVGKCRSDPARLRAQGKQRGRGRHSLDIGRDLKRPLTIDETVQLPPSFSFAMRLSFLCMSTVGLLHVSTGRPASSLLICL